MRPAHDLLLAAACLAAGLASGLLLRPASSDEMATPAATTTPAADLATRLDRLEEELEALHATVFMATSGGAGSRSVDGGASIDQIVAALRRELDRSARTTPPSEEEARAEQAAIEAKPENAPAQARAERVVSQALAARRWTMEDAQVLRESLGRLSPQQAGALLERLFPAVNRGEIEVETPGPLF